jgi:Protein of unknown function (DUF2637)
VGPREISAAALAAFGLIAAAVTTVAITESYGNLYAFAVTHGLHGWRAAIAPAAVDSFIVMGELLLFSALLRQWEGRSAYALGTGMAAWGFILSVGGNVWHAASASPPDRAVAAIWPVTATAGMAGALIIVKRLTVGQREPAPAPVPVPVSAAAASRPDRTPPPVPSSPSRELRTRTPAGRKARGTALAAAKAEAEAELAGWLAGLDELPSVRGLAAHEKLAGHGSLATRRRAAERLIEAVRDQRLIAEAAGLRDKLIESASGVSHGDGDGS